MLPSRQDVRKYGARATSQCGSRRRRIFSENSMWHLVLFGGQVGNWPAYQGRLATGPTSACHWPQVDQTHGLDALGPDDVDSANAIRLRPQLLLDCHQPPVPVPPVGIQLPEFLLVEQTWGAVAALLYRGGDALLLLLQNGPHGQRFTLAPFRQHARRPFG